jgi:hypothetical protein
MAGFTYFIAGKGQKMWKSFFRIFFPSNEPPPSQVKHCDNEVYAELYSLLADSADPAAGESLIVKNDQVLANARG